MGLLGLEKNGIWMGRQNCVFSDGLVSILMSLRTHVKNIWPVSQCLGEHWPALTFHMLFFSWDFKNCVGPSICLTSTPSGKEKCVHCSISYCHDKWQNFQRIHIKPVWKSNPKGLSTENRTQWLFAMIIHDLRFSKLATIFWNDQYAYPEITIFLKTFSRLVALEYSFQCIIELPCGTLMHSFIIPKSNLPWLNWFYLWVFPVS